MAKGRSLSGVPEQRYPIRGEVLMNIGEMQRKLSLWAEQDQGRKFYGLFDLVSEMDWLRLAHDYVAQNAGSRTAGCDGVVMTGFDEDLEGNLRRLHAALKSGTFVACPVRRVNIPKANGKVRPLGIPTICDRIVQEAVRMALEPIYEADFSQRSFGFRPNRCTMDAIRHLTGFTSEHARYFWVIEGDISAYFDTICHRKLMKLLRRRVGDEKLLDLIWGFLRSGVMERKLFKDTKLGTPQGGIVSPLLANVYLHELDQHMKRYDLSPAERNGRRKWGLANFAYARYADDFVILCNGTQEQALEMRQEVHDFLRDTLRLTLSMEKTKVVHLNGGFDFLGFHLRRSMGSKGMVTKILISEKAIERHRTAIRTVTSPKTHQESVVAKILALNRIIAGWCRYFQYTSKTSIQFAPLRREAFWRLAHWLGRKFKLTMPNVLHRFRNQGSLGDGKVTLTLHSSFPARRYHISSRKPNPYTTQEAIRREELPDDHTWPRAEQRPGMMDLRNLVVERDGFVCRICKEGVTYGTAQVDHILPVKCFRRPVDANRLGNLWTLCNRCHKEKTEIDRQRESRVR
jgi:RNA-directed DNA polymerase